MSNKPQITTHYADGRPSETRDMTDKEILQLPPKMEPTDEASIINAHAVPSVE
jgi:hypothetical protein